MRAIYHLVPRDEWEKSVDPYQAASLVDEGFIHCSHADQVEVIANLFYADVKDLLVLQVDADQIGDLLKEEVPALPDDLQNVAELQGTFPHVYGPIPHSAVVAVIPLQRDRERWTFSQP